MTESNVWSRVSVRPNRSIRLGNVYSVGEDSWAAERPAWVIRSTARSEQARTAEPALIARDMAGPLAALDRGPSPATHEPTAPQPSAQALSGGTAESGQR